MKIKKLSIQGFKSFVDRTVFHIPEGTSAIVGPNGCGKSNIVDAIRWVLGEQNARHLRGKVMEDLIFGGSEKRKPVGMAEVALTLSNEGGNAPARYSTFNEIEVMRRVYRSGDSEYFINKVPSRLKDITELFTDTGIGTRAYSIIEQGQVGWLITAKPSERRVIFEEAAGINKYKQKKDSALRKLDATKENLTRVGDIISEVKRQLNSLNRQAKKAERYKEYKDELKGLELYLSSLDYQKALGEKKAKEKYLNEEQDKELKIKSSLSEKESLYVEKKSAYDELEAEYKGVRDKLYEAERNMQSFESKGELARARSEELKRNIERLTNEIKETDIRKGMIEEELTTLEGLMTDEGSLLSQDEERLTSAVNSFESVEKEVREREDRVRTLESECLKMVTRISDIRHTLSSTLREEEMLKERESKNKTTLRESEESLKEIEAPFENIKTKVDELRGKKDTTEASLKTSEEKLLNIEDNYENSRTELRNKKEDLTAKTSRKNTLIEMAKTYGSSGEGLKSILNNSVNGITSKGQLSEHLQVEEGYEKSLQSVLSHMLKYVLVHDADEALKGIDYLRNKNERAGFIPVSSLKDASNPASNSLASKVITDASSENVLTALLSDTVVVDTIEDALSYWKSDPSKRVVTKKGELITKEGVITGGDEALLSTSLFESKHKVEDLAIEITGLEKEIGFLDENLINASKELNKEKETYKELRDEFHKEEVEFVAVENEFKGYEIEMLRLKETRDKVVKDIEESEEQLVNLEVKKKELTKERDELEIKVVEEEKEKEIQKISFTEDKVRLDKERESLTDIKVTLASKKERFEAVKNQLSDKKRFLNENTGLVENKSREIEKAREEIEIKKTEIEDFAKRVEELFTEREEVKRNEILMSEKLGDIADQFKSFEENVQRDRKEINELQDGKNQATIALREAEMMINNLQEKIIEKYGVDIATYSPDSDIAEKGLDNLREKQDDLREKIGKMGEVSLSALEEHRELEERYNFLNEQKEDLEKSVNSLLNAVNKINKTTREKFKETFDLINEEFKKNFPRFFNGGRAELQLTEGDDVLEAGVDIVSQPPGKRLQNINLLSGGEKALTATALIFSIFLIKPSPFCLLDEVDAPLDEANIDRFNAFVREMSKMSQFILISHSKRTMEMADSLFGITMEEPGVSKAVTVDLASV